MIFLLNNFVYLEETIGHFCLTMQYSAQHAKKSPTVEVRRLEDTIEVLYLSCSTKYEHGNE